MAEGTSSQRCHAWLLALLIGIGEAEREMERQLAQMRREIAHLVVDLLPARRQAKFRQHRKLGTRLRNGHYGRGALALFMIR